MEVQQKGCKTVFHFHLINFKFMYLYKWVIFIMNVIKQIVHKSIVIYLDKKNIRIHHINKYILKLVLSTKILNQMLQFTYIHVYE